MKGSAVVISGTRVFIYNFLFLFFFDRITHAHVYFGCTTESESRRYYVPTCVVLFVLGGINVYEKRHSCNDSAREKKDKAFVEASGTDRRQTNGRNIIRRSSERRIYRSRSNGWRGCDSNPLSLGLTPSPLSSLHLQSTPSPFSPTLRFHRNSPPHCCSNVLSVPLYLTFAIFLNSRKIIIRRRPTSTTIKRDLFVLFSTRDKILNRKSARVRWGRHFC